MTDKEILETMREIRKVAKTIFPEFNELINEVIVKITFQTEIAHTDGWVIYIHPLVFEKYSFEFNIMLFLHELLHIYYYDTQTSVIHGLEPTSWNYATDMSNDAILIQRCQEKGIWDEEYVRLYQNIKASIEERIGNIDNLTKIELYQKIYDFIFFYLPTLPPKNLKIDQDEYKTLIKNIVLKIRRAELENKKQKEVV
jgi:UDP-2,3-diacylglucosamine pyrophosphatase LpxH